MLLPNNSFGSIVQGKGSQLISTKFISNTVAGNAGIALFNLFNDLELNSIKVTNDRFNLIASTIIIKNSIFNNLLTISSTDTTRGGFVFLFACDATLNNSTFTNGKAQYGGALYVFGTAFSSELCTFTGNEALMDGGAYYASILSQFTILKDTFTDNKAAGGGDALAMKNINDYLNVKNCTFSSSFPPQFIKGKLKQLKHYHTYILLIFSSSWIFIPKRRIQHFYPNPSP
jgi:hypothetical protein